MPTGRRQRTAARQAVARLSALKPQYPNLIVAMRLLVVLLLCSTLAACAAPAELPLWKPYVSPSAPATSAVSDGIKRAVAEEKVGNPIEISAVHQTDHGPGAFVICLRGAGSVSGQRATYAAFFDNNDYKGSRLSVMIDDCEKQDYRPFP